MAAEKVGEAARVEEVLEETENSDEEERKSALFFAGPSTLLFFSLSCNLSP